MSPATVNLYALAALLGLAPAVLRATLTRAGVRLGPKGQATEEDLARVFGRDAAREFASRLAQRSGRGR